MSDSAQPIGVVERTNEAVADSVERNIEAQAALIEAWTDAFGGMIPDEEVVDEGVSGYVSAYEVWLDGVEELFDRIVGGIEGEDLQPEELRDIWLQTSNDALSELMSTGAFAAVDEQFIDTVLEAQIEVDEIVQDSLSQAGFATRKDTAEVAERLVELERRQQAVEETLDAILDAVEE
jgi:hypothetical protein